MATAAKVKRDIGERARLIDVPVPRVSAGGIFDRLECSEDAIPEKARQLAKQVTETVEQHYGVAFPPFIAYVVKHRATVLRRFEAIARQFVERYAPGDNWERRFALKFGYACAGGLVAIRAGVLPCNRRQVISATRKLYRAARGCFTTDTDLRDTALKKLLGAIDDDQRFPRVENEDQVPDDFATASWGFRRHYPKLGDCLGIRAEHLRQWAVTDDAFDQVVADLKAAGAHVQGRDKMGLTHIRELRGGGRRRYILLRLPVLKRMRKPRRATA